MTTRLHTPLVLELTTRMIGRTNGVLVELGEAAALHLLRFLKRHDGEVIARDRTATSFVQAPQSDLDYQRDQMFCEELYRLLLRDETLLRIGFTGGTRERPGAFRIESSMRYQADYLSMLVVGALNTAHHNTRTLELEATTALLELEKTASAPPATTGQTAFMPPPPPNATPAKPPVAASPPRVLQEPPAPIALGA